MASPLLLLAAAFVVDSAKPAPKPAPKTIPELEARIRQILDSAKVPGIGLAIVRHDSIVYTGGLGLARVSPKVVATDTTLFRIGSTSKAFVALTAQALVKEGKLDLNTPLAQALPGFYFKNPWESTDPVRIVNLLEHTAGFDDNSLKAYADNDPTPRKLADGLAIDSLTRVSRWRPGTRFSYCNTGPAIVALIIEKIEGKPFEQVVQERWFTPIGMKTATYFRPDTTKFATATLYNADGKTAVPYWHVFVRPAGSINANAHDMGAYVRFLLGRGSVGGTELLPKASIERMERSESSLMSRAGLTVGYGLHLYRTPDTTGFTWTAHNGGVEGGLSDMSYLPDYGVGYAFQINSGNGEAMGMITKLVRAFMVQGLTPPAEPPVVKVAEATRRDFTGWYRSVSPRMQHIYALERYTTLQRVTFTDSGMLVSPLLGDKPMKFVAVDSLIFRRPGQTAKTMAFVRDPENDRPLGIEAASGGLGGSFEKISEADALGGVTIAVLWLVGCVLSLVAMVWGSLRWIVRKVRKAEMTPVAAATTWRYAALTTIVLFVQVIMLLSGTGNLQTLGSFGAYSATVWLLGLAFIPLLLLGLSRSWRSHSAPTRWGMISMMTGRAALILSLGAAIFLVRWGWIGWKTWAG